MNISTLNELLLQKEVAPRVSIIVSTELKSFSDKEKIQLKFKNIIDAVTKELQSKYDKKIVNSIVSSIKLSFKQVDLNHQHKGIGIYASSGFIRQVVFPFTVKEKLIINRYFEVSDVIETLDKLFNYFVLVLSKNKTRFFEGKGTTLIEIMDGNFPLHNENEYQMERTPSQYMKNNGVDVSQVKNIRIEDYFRKIDKLMNKFVKNEPLVILGVTKYLSTYKALSRHRNLIIAELEGNFDKHTPHAISELVWSKIENYSLKEKAYYSSHM